MGSSADARGAGPLLGEAFRLLDEAEVPWREIPGPRLASATTALTLLVATERLEAARAILRRVGFAALPARGRGATSLLVAYDEAEGGWVELRLTAAAGAQGGPPGRTEAALRMAQGVLGRVRGRGLGVALVGADGAGKSSLAAALADGFYFPVRSIYMGLYQEGSRGRRARLPGLGLLVAVLRQFGRWLGGLRHRLLGRLVLFDRYTYDALLPAQEPLTARLRLRRYVLARACPRPDLVLILDAPAEVLYARAPEHEPGVLEGHRDALLGLAARVPAPTVVIDAQQDPEAVVREATAAIWRRYGRHWADR